MKVRALIVCLVIASTTAAGTGQAQVTRLELSTLPDLAVGQNLRIKKVMGQIGTFMIGTFKAGWKNTPHHHTHEQINVGLGGAFNIVTPATPHEVSRLRGLLIPPDVFHGNDVSSATDSPLLIEFQPVRRVDFPPEREKVAFRIAAAPVTAPEGMDLDFRAESTTWRRLAEGIRVNSKKGVGAAVSAWEMSSAAKNAIDLRPQITGAEQFVYVFEGAVDVTVGAERHAAPAGTLLVIAPNATAQIRATGALSRLLVFEATKVQ